MKKPRYKVAVVTGSRAEFGLLEPVMKAVRAHKRLQLQVIAAGAHFLPPARTIREVEAKFALAARVPMQRPGKTGRAADAAAVARGIDGFTRAFARLKPDWVVVLGDRIEAFAAAGAASIAGYALCHIHGGDRAEGIADEAMRHAITKLAHLHCAATKLSARRIVSMGERSEHVHVTGSPAIDGLNQVKAMSDSEARRFGDPAAVVLFHPCGLTEAQETEWTNKALVRAKAFVDPLCRLTGKQMFERVLLVDPNADAGREIITETWDAFKNWGAHRLTHLPRSRFLALLKRLAVRGGVLIGNSSAGLIEAAALRTAAVNLGPRQAGRERGGNVIDIPINRLGTGRLESRRLRRLLNRGIPARHPFGDGRAGPRIASLLARTDPHNAALLRKRNTY